MELNKQYWKPYFLLRNSLVVINSEIPKGWKNLLDCGIFPQVNGVTVDWHTPLFNSCVSGSVDCLNLLLEHGASLHPPCDLASPIHEAAKRGNPTGTSPPFHVASSMWKWKREIKKIIFLVWVMKNALLIGLIMRGAVLPTPVAHQGQVSSAVRSPEFTLWHLEGNHCSSQLLTMWTFEGDVWLFSKGLERNMEWLISSSVDIWNESDEMWGIYPVRL